MLLSHECLVLSFLGTLVLQEHRLPTPCPVIELVTQTAHLRELGAARVLLAGFSMHFEGGFCHFRVGRTPHQRCSGFSLAMTALPVQLPYPPQHQKNQQAPPYSCSGCSPHIFALAQLCSFSFSCPDILLEVKANTVLPLVWLTHLS